MAEKVNTDCFDEENPNYCNDSMFNVGRKKIFPYIAFESGNKANSFG